MIKINLLPEELRPLEKTPLGRLLVMLVGVALTASSLALFGMLRFSTLRIAQREKEEAEITKAEKEIIAAEHDVLEQEIAFYQLRINTVKKIRRERYIWSRKLYQLWEVIADSSPDIALTQVSISELPGSGGRPSRMEIVIDGYSVIPELKSAADFMRSLRGAEFFLDCEDISPENTVVRSEGEKGRICEFTLRVTMKPQKPSPQTAQAR
jgi:hypothetical protein